MQFLIKGYNPAWGSHIPVLIDIFNKSKKGPVLELGVGIFSTPLLHALCVENKRMLVSYENDPEFFEMHQTFNDEFHQINMVDNWDNIDIDNTHWAMVFVDHKPAGRRVIDTKRLANIADFVVIHDSEQRSEGQYNYNSIYPLFKYRKNYVFKEGMAETTILSNFFNLD